jgi:predicted GNAT superfamily acetyltransferase
MDIREFHERDFEWVLTLNNDNIPAVSGLSVEDLRHLIKIADRILIAEEDGLSLGVLILMREGHLKSYQSKNYAWLTEKFDRHLYIDRIMIGSEARGRGIGKRLYHDAAILANSLKLPLTAEVNVVPDNPASHAFHQRVGFEAVGDIDHAPDYKVRCYKK